MAAAYFSILDTNKDGKLTQSERAITAPFVSETDNTLDMIAVIFFSSYDAKSDDVFTLEEWKNYITYLFDYHDSIGRKINN